VETGAPTYAVPATNPFVGQAGFRPEIWAFGLRNPWRFSFAGGAGDLFIADVGQDMYEEIDFQPAASTGGQNYGWNIMEGLHCYNTATCNSTGLTLPVSEYDHSQGDCSVTGGFVYRGTQFRVLQGIYVYGDYCSGRIWGLRPTPGAWQSAVLYGAGFQISSFGEDEAGEIYVADYTDGAITHLISGCAGDCNDDRRVSIDELLTMVNIALGTVTISSCSTGDVNRDNEITVDEILTAVGNAQNGCAAS
jgi:glucose/sorbosone dehydrogenase